MTYASARDRTCEHCGETFLTRDYRRRFCGRQCAARGREHQGTPPVLTGSAHGRWQGGTTAHPLYPTYHSMLDRCTRVKNPAWKNYGGRGITVCQRWRDSFWDFVADVGERPEGRSLDRIDNDGPYAPDNVRWATRSEQRINSRQPEKESASV